LSELPEAVTHRRACLSRNRFAGRAWRCPSRRRYHRRSDARRHRIGLHQQPRSGHSHLFGPRSDHVDRRTGTTASTSPTTTPLPRRRPLQPRPVLRRLRPRSVSPGAKLSVGSTGPAVLALQKRLVSLGYWIGTPDGVYGDSTQQAVYALQKAAGIGRDGSRARSPMLLLQRASSRTRAAPPVRHRSRSRRRPGDVRQQGKLEYVLNTSTGGGYTYSDGGGGTAIRHNPNRSVSTPTARSTGLVTDYLGQLWMPSTSPVASPSTGLLLPPEPVSHGCVRVSDEAIEWIWANNLDPIGTTVWAT